MKFDQDPAPSADLQAAAPPWSDIMSKQQPLSASQRFLPVTARVGFILLVLGFSSPLVIWWLNSDSVYVSPVFYVMSIMSVVSGVALYALSRLGYKRACEERGMALPRSGLMGYRQPPSAYAQQPPPKKQFVNKGLLTGGSIVFLLGIASATFIWFTEIKTGLGDTGGTGFAYAFVVFPLVLTGIELIVHSFFPGRPTAKLVLVLALGSMLLIQLVLNYMDPSLFTYPHPDDLIYSVIILPIEFAFLSTGVLLGIEGLIRLMLYLVRLAIP